MSKTPNSLPRLLDSYYSFVKENFAWQPIGPWALTQPHGHRGEDVLGHHMALIELEIQMSLT
jgi:hypothetical protein